LPLVLCIGMFVVGWELIPSWFPAFCGMVYVRAISIPPVRQVLH
jgi:hypothetical protein